MPMHCLRSSSASEFLEVAESSLLLHETEHNLVLGLATDVAQGRLSASEAVFVIVAGAGATAGYAVQTRADLPLALSRMIPSAVTALVEYILAQDIRLSGVVGPIESSESFVRSWDAATRTKSRLVMHQGVYQLDRVINPDSDGGKLAQATGFSTEIVRQYLLGFVHDAFPEEKDPQGVAEQLLERYRTKQGLFFWKSREGQPVSMAAKARETRNAATISLVYTPPELRRRGHASCVVAALSDMQLKSGKKFCNLFTDLRNPTSNSIYQKIGYRQVGESKHFALERGQSR